MHDFCLSCSWSTVVMCYLLAFMLSSPISILTFTIFHYVFATVILSIVYYFEYICKFIWQLVWPILTHFFNDKLTSKLLISIIGIIVDCPHCNHSRLVPFYSVSAKIICQWFFVDSRPFSSSLGLVWCYHPSLSVYLSILSAIYRYSVTRTLFPLLPPLI